MTRRLVSGVAVGMLAAAISGSVAAQISPMFGKADPKGYVGGTAGCDPKNCAYVIDSWGVPNNNVVKSGSYNGALTYYLVESITEAEGKLTYRELHQRTRAKLKQEDFDQIPQLEGRRTSFDRLFLS